MDLQYSRYFRSVVFLCIGMWFKILVCHYTGMCQSSDQTTVLGQHHLTSIIHNFPAILTQQREHQSTNVLTQLT
jgi:hypothetical protein